MRKFLAMAGVVALASAWAVMPASAGVQRTIDVSPPKGPVGTVITVSGSGCNGVGVSVELDNHDDATIVHGTFPTDDSWSGTLTVPSDTPAGTYVVRAFCDEGEDTGFNYTPAGFEVTVTELATTTTTVAPTTTTTVEAPTTTVPAPVVEQAPPAQPVVAQPVTAG